MWVEKAIADYIVLCKAFLSHRKGLPVVTEVHVSQRPDRRVPQEGSPRNGGLSLQPFCSVFFGSPLQPVSHRRVFFPHALHKRLPPPAPADAGHAKQIEDLQNSSCQQQNNSIAELPSGTALFYEFRSVNIVCYIWYAGACRISCLIAFSN